MYIVTSKPKRISVNSGLVHIIFSRKDMGYHLRFRSRPLRRLNRDRLDRAGRFQIQPLAPDWRKHVKVIVLTAIVRDGRGSSHRNFSICGS